MTETAKTPKAKKPTTEKKERKPRASNAAIAFAQKLEAAAKAKLDSAAESLRDRIDNSAREVAADLGVSDVNALLTYAVGASVGVAKHNVVAAQNKIQPGITERVLESAGV